VIGDSAARSTDISVRSELSRVRSNASRAPRQRGGLVDLGRQRSAFAVRAATGFIEGHEHVSDSQEHARPPRPIATTVSIFRPESCSSRA